jgi:MFS family permease
MLTGRIVSRTGFTAIFPSIGLIFATATLVLLALVASYLGIRQLVIVLFCAGVFMGTVMAVVQVTVQNAAGPAALGSAAASVQLARSIGAAAGTALVGTVLFATIAFGDPRTAQVFAALLGRGTLADPSVLSSPVLRAEIATAFQAAFLTIAGFSAIGVGLAWSIPARRLSGCQTLRV